MVRPSSHAEYKRDGVAYFTAASHASPRLASGVPDIGKLAKQAKRVNREPPPFVILRHDPAISYGTPLTNMAGPGPGKDDRLP